MEVVYITDENYAMPTGISMLSLLENTHAPLSIHIIAADVSAKQKKYWKRIASSYKATISIIETHKEIYSDIASTCLSAGIHVTATSLFKFDIPNLLNSTNKVLYLDSDIIVQADITELWDKDLTNYYVAAADDMGDSKSDDGGSASGERIHLTGSHYFNSGVMLLNLEKMRADDIPKKLLMYRVSRENYFMDQDAFNAVLQHQRLILPYSCNFITTVFDKMLFENINKRFFLKRMYHNLQDCIDDQCILHFADWMKPWNYNMPWVTDIFLEYYKRSPYKDQTLTLRSPLAELQSTISEQNKIISDISQQFERNVKSNAIKIKQLKAKMDWHFPREKVPAGSKIIIYGAGEVGTSFIRQMAETHYCFIVLWVDSDYANKGSSVHAPEKIKECNFDYVVVAVYNEKKAEEICSYLEQMGIVKEKIVVF